MWLLVLHLFWLFPLFPCVQTTTNNFLVKHLTNACYGSTMNDMNTTTLTQNAEARGYERGVNDALALAEKNDFPLSGEWAGESMTELIGDLIAKAENDEHGHEICMAYEEGYSLGYDDTKVEEILRMGNKD